MDFQMRVEVINPFVSATLDVFKTMLGCALTRGPLSLKHEHTPMYEVSGLIGLSGQCRGMVVLSISRATAIAAAEGMLGARPDGLNRDVMDAVGELANMIAGAAKTRLAQYRLTIGLPTVICGKVQAIAFPPEALPIVIPFDSEIGAVCVQVGLVESPVG
jgi:chemotaxis protein CheX